MSTQLIVAITTLVILIVYLAVIRWKFGVLPSISESANRWKYPQIFSMWCFVTSFNITYILTSPNGITSWNDLVICLSILGLFLVGIYYAFKRKFIDKLHYIGASMAMLGTQAYMFMLGYWEYNIIFATLTILKLIIHDKKVYKVDEKVQIIEIYAFVTFIVFVIKLTSLK